MNRVYALFILLLAVGCSSTLTLHGERNDITPFAADKGIYVHTEPEIVNLSSRLMNELTRAGFTVVKERDKAGYILSFDYRASFDVYPWVFRSFSIEMAGPDQKPFYSLKSDKPGAEPVTPLIQRAVQIMSESLMAGMPNRPYLTISGSQEEIPPPAHSEMASPAVEDVPEIESVSPMEQSREEKVTEQPAEQSQPPVDTAYYIELGKWNDPAESQYLFNRIKEDYPEAYLSRNDGVSSIRIPGIESWGQGIRIFNEVKEKFNLSPVLVKVK